MRGKRTATMIPALSSISTAYKRLILLAALLCAPVASAQNSLVPGQPVFIGPATNPHLGANLTITFCTSTATGIPCSPLAQAYADSTNSNPINQSSNPLKTDALGNFPVFYALPAQYSYTITGPGLAAPQGPYQILVGSGGAGSILSSNNVFTGINEFLNHVFFGGQNPWVDVTTTGGRAVATIPQTTCGMTSGQYTAALASGVSFQNGDGVMCYGAGATNALSTPGTPTVTPSLAASGTQTGRVANSAAGSSSYSYKIVARDPNGGLTAASPAGSTSTGLGTLGTSA